MGILEREWRFGGGSGGILVNGKLEVWEEVFGCLERQRHFGRMVGALCRLTCSNTQTFVEDLQGSVRAWVSGSSHAPRIGAWIG